MTPEQTTLCAEALLFMSDALDGTTREAEANQARALAAALNAQETPAKPRETVPLYVALASAFEHWHSVQASGNQAWHARRVGAIIGRVAAQSRERVEYMCANYLPSGSGWDLGTKFVPEASRPDHMVFSGSWHHMDEGGMYDGWTDHNVIVRPSLSAGFYIRITGKNRNDIKSYLHEMFDYALRQQVDRWCGYETRNVNMDGVSYTESEG